MAGDNWALPNPVVLLVIIAVGSASTLGLAGYALFTLARGLRRRQFVETGFRCAATLAAASAIAMYVWGALHLLVDETAADQMCKAAVGPAHAGHVDRYETSFVPLRFGCHVAAGGTYEAAVPGYVNPSVAFLIIATIVLAFLAVFEASGPGVSDESSTELRVK